MGGHETQLLGGIGVIAATAPSFTASNQPQNQLGLKQLSQLALQNTYQKLDSQGMPLQNHYTNIYPSQQVYPPHPIQYIIYNPNDGRFYDHIGNELHIPVHQTSSMSDEDIDAQVLSLIELAIEKAAERLVEELHNTGTALEKCEAAVRYMAAVADEAAIEAYYQKVKEKCKLGTYRAY